MGDRVGIGIIGTGFARRVQIPAFLACESASVLSVASGSLENAQATADEFGIGHLTADWHETILHPEVDLVCITTPPDLHCEIALFAIENGKNVLCEKPMAMSVAEAADMAKAAAGKSLFTAIDHELRFQPGRLAAYRMLREGVIGKVRHVKAIFHAPHRGDPKTAWNWWSDASAGGGALGAIGSHCIDSMQWLLGTSVKSVYCQLQTHIRLRIDANGVERPVTSDDESNLVIRLEDSELSNNATGTISVSMTEGPHYRNALELHGTDGAMRIEHLGELFISRAGEADWTPVEVGLGSPFPGVQDTGFARAFLEFAPRIIDTLRRGDTSIEHAATFYDGVGVQRVLDAARESDKSGRVVTID